MEEMEEILTRDNEMRSELIDILQKTRDVVSSAKHSNCKELAADMERLADVDKEIERHVKELSAGECPIVVAGKY